VKYVRLYGFDHTRTQAQFNTAWRELREAVPKRKGSVVLGVSDDQLLLDGVPFETKQSERGFAQLLSTAGIASIHFASTVTVEEFETLVRAFAFGGSKAKDFAAYIKQLFPDGEGDIQIDIMKFVAADTASVDVTAAAQTAVQSLAPELREWLSEPSKLIHLIAAAQDAKSDPRPHADQMAFDLQQAEAEPQAQEVIFALNERETVEALRLLTRFGEHGTGPSPKPEMIGLELHRSEEKISQTVLSTLDELSATHDAKADPPLLVRAAEQMAIRYALEHFQSGDLKVNGVHPLLEELSSQMADLRKLLSVHEEKTSKAGMLPESHADLLDRMFWAEIPEHGKKKALLSEDAACVPARNVHEYVQLLLQRGDRETASAFLQNYASQASSSDAEYRAKAANGLLQLTDMLLAAGGNVLGDSAQKIGDALSKETDPELEALLSAAFVRLCSEATQRKRYRAVAQACETMDYLASRRPALEPELRSRIGVEARLPDFIEDALNQQRVAPDLINVLHCNSRAAAEHLAERFFRSMRREECDSIVDLVHELGISANDYLCEMLRNGPQRQAVSSVGLLSRLDVPGLLEFLPTRLPGWNRFYHDVIVRQIAYGNASDRGRTLLEILEILDPAVVPQALDEIGMSGDRSAAPPLIVMAAAGETQGRSPLLQMKAIEALGRLREPDAVPVLKNLFEAKRMFKWQHHRELRIAAAQALAKIDPRYATQIMADSGLEPGELAIGPLDSAPACPWVRQRRYERIVLRQPVAAVISSSWGRSMLSVRELSLGGGMGTKEDALRIGSDADIDIQVGMRHIRGQVLLRRARVNEVGFEFVNTDLDSRHRLRHVLMDSLEHTPEHRPGKWNFDRGQ
jgi:hypothetical protein